MEFPIWPFYDNDEIESVIKVLRSGKVNYWTGDIGKKFEVEFANFLGINYAVALSNGTVALEVALHALGIGTDDEVIVPCRTFIATASSATLSGAKPIIVDIDLQTQNISLSAIERAYTHKTKAIIVVHLGGLPCDMEPILKFALEKKLWVIEDCAQAIGAKYKEQYVGTIGHIGTFSFCQDKIISSGGEGGMLVTRDETIWSKAWSYKDHGKDFYSFRNPPTSAGYRWVHKDVGNNFRMTELQAAIARCQLMKVNSWLIQRKSNAEIYHSYIDKIPALTRTYFNEKIINHAYYQYYIFVKNDLLKPDWNRDRILKSLKEEGVPCSVGACPDLNQEEAFIKRYGRKEFLQNAKLIGSSSIVLPVYPTLQARHIHQIGQILQEIMTRASK